MVTLGDTGCKIQSGQNCNWSYKEIANWWPFPNIIQNAAKADPDLVIHVGDYRYYNENVTPDTWHYWFQDFFKPAQALLLKAPWAFRRGNHEQCIDTSGKIWYGAGFLFLFGTLAEACPDPATEPGPRNLKTWHFDVAVGGIDTDSSSKTAHRFVMIDTSNGGKGVQGTHFDDAVKASNSANGSWWVSHIPGTVLLGHQHMFQQVEFFDPVTGRGDYVWPQSYIVGHRGVKLRTLVTPAIIALSNIFTLAMENCTRAGSPTKRILAMWYGNIMPAPSITASLDGSQNPKTQKATRCPSIRL